MSTYTLYLDESGDHGLAKFNPDYPVLALCGVAVEDAAYGQVVVPQLDAFKVDQFGSASIRLHYRAMSLRAGPFKRLAQPTDAWLFEQSLARLVAGLPLTIFCAVIKKDEYTQKYGRTRPVDPYLPVDLYLMALDFVLERLVKHLEERPPASAMVIAESRGQREDDQVGAEYAELMLRGTQFVSGERFRAVLTPELRFASKKEGIAGLEIADICAAPIATQVLKPGSPSPMWEAIRTRIWIGSGPRKQGSLGLKCFPRAPRLDDLFGGLGR